MVAAVLVTVILYNLWGSGWRTVLTVAGVMTVVSYVLVGVGPRTLGRQHAYGVALATAASCGCSAGCSGRWPRC